MIIGIDPGLNGSGFASYDLTQEKFTAIEKMQLWELYDYMQANPDDIYLIENSNLDKRNYHGSTARGGVGKNKAVSQLIADYAEALKLRYSELKPAGYSKVYTDSRGRYTKLYQKAFEQDANWDKQTNKDSRAAVAMVLRNLALAKHMHRAFTGSTIR